MTMNMNQQGREMMRRADEAMRATAAADGLRKRLAEAKTEAEREPVKREAFACIGLYPAHAALFSDVAADINRLNGTGPATAADVARLGDRVAEANAKAAKPAKKARKVKDTRPRWKKEHREAYNRNLHDWIASGMSDREAAQASIKWAAGNSKLVQYKTPSASSLEKWAAAERKLMARRRKRS